MERSEWGKRLAALRPLKREAELLSRRIAELEAAERRGGSAIRGMPQVKRKYDDVRYIRERVQELEAQLRRRREDCLAQLIQIERILGEVEDAQMREILFLRYVEGRKWWEIAVRMEFSGEQIPRKKHNAFLEKISKG